MNSRIRCPLYISLNPDYVAARSLWSLRSNKNCSNHSAVTMLTTLATEEKAKPGNNYTQSQPIFNQKWLEKCYTMYYWEIQPNQI